MATEMGKTDLAEQIKQAAHAGKAKGMKKNIASDEERWEWEQKASDGALTASQITTMSRI